MAASSRTAAREADRMSIDVAAAYRSAASSIIAVYEAVDDDLWGRMVPCTPLWTVRDLLSHTAGVADDVVNARVEGAATDPWTAAQVERFRDEPVTVMLDRWKSQIDTVAEALQAIGEVRPVFDTVTHEHDLRHALARPGDRNGELVTLLGAMLAETVTGDLPVTVELTTGRRFGAAGPTVSELTPFEAFRSRLGRRSRDQIATYAWTGEPLEIAAVIDAWSLFPPPPAPIIE
jgi:uncharacterized protein (TIGR03083 family)